MIKKLSEIKEGFTDLGTHITQGGLIYIPRKEIERWPRCDIKIDADTNETWLYMSELYAEPLSDVAIDYLYVSERLFKSVFENSDKTSLSIIMEQVAPLTIDYYRSWRWLVKR